MLSPDYIEENYFVEIDAGYKYKPNISVYGIDLESVISCSRSHYTHIDSGEKWHVRILSKDESLKYISKRYKDSLREFWDNVEDQFH